MGPIQAITTCFRKYATFSGRASRSEYWWFTALSLGGSIIIFTSLIFISETDEDTSDIIILLWLTHTFITIIPYITVSWRRIHDTGHPGYWALLPPFLFTATFYYLFGYLPEDTNSFFEISVGSLILLLVLWAYWFSRSPNTNDNQFGPAPYSAKYSELEKQRKSLLLELMKATNTCFKKYFILSGRASRSEFWWFICFQGIVGLALGIGELGYYGLESEQTGLASTAVMLLFFCPNLTVSFRRLHDTGKSGWYLLLPAAGFVVGITFGAITGNLLGQAASIISGIIIVMGYLILLWWYIKPSDPNENKYGPPPNDTTLSPNPNLNEVTP